MNDHEEAVSRLQAEVLEAAPEWASLAVRLLNE
jgi:hypothetical protein